MKIYHHYTVSDRKAFMHREAILHRRCLLLLQARMNQSTRSGMRKAG
ncbi:MAG: hypothetical protein HFF19_01510 [Oscillospiraceae bacterium]|jgi:hypothetical protein|nr:hypothetical protein [Oscillospiraceae bacterium]